MSRASLTPAGGPARRVDALSWALAFIWIGVGLLARVGWGWLLIGLGSITLGAQVALRLSHERTSGFWIAAGAVLLASGVWELLQLNWPLAPALLILVGVAILVNALRGGRTAAGTDA